MPPPRRPGSELVIAPREMAPSLPPAASGFGGQAGGLAGLGGGALFGQSADELLEMPALSAF